MYVFGTSGQALHISTQQESDFMSKKKSGLNIHMTRKHDKMERIDGDAEIECNDSDSGESEEIFFGESDLISDQCGGDDCWTLNCKICIDKARLLYSSLKKK